MLPEGRVTARERKQIRQKSGDLRCHSEILRVRAKTNNSCSKTYSSSDNCSSTHFDYSCSTRNNSSCNNTRCQNSMENLGSTDSSDMTGSLGMMDSSGSSDTMGMLDSFGSSWGRLRTLMWFGLGMRCRSILRSIRSGCRRSRLRIVLNGRRLRWAW